MKDTVAILLFITILIIAYNLKIEITNTCTKIMIENNVIFYKSNN